MFKRTVFLMSILVAVYGCGGGESSDQDTTAPTVISKSPENNATGVAVNSTVTVTFSEAMSSSSIDGTTFSVRTGGIDISGSPIYYGTFATFQPITTLQAFKGYTATVTTGVKDSNGNALASNYSWGFITGSSSTSTVSFARDVQPIFDSNCIVCHTSLGQAAFLPLTDDVSYGNLVNQSSQYTGTPPSGTLVTPGDSSNSVLYQRISGIGLAAGEQTMPQNQSLLNSDSRDLIETWINEGALNN